MNITITITTTDAAALEHAVQSAQQELPALTPQKWSVTATIEVPDELSPYELHQQLSKVPGIAVRLVGDAIASN